MASLTIVTGAPAAGKSTIVAELLRMKTDLVVFDIDWLAESAGQLAGRDIYTDAATWDPYGRLWSDVIEAVARNGKRVIFFVPNTPTDIEQRGDFGWCDNVRWLLLDCTDDVRADRLNARSNWTEDRRQEALIDARELREFDLPTLDTGCESVLQLASRIVEFATQ